MSDVLELMLGDHLRIRRLLAALDDAAQYSARNGRGGQDWTLAASWARFATLLTLHVDVEQEICFLPMYRGRTNWLDELDDAVAAVNDVRDAVAEARLHQALSPAWWRAARAARRAICEHILTMERGALADFKARSSAGLRQQLGRQWAACVAARQRDGVYQEREFAAIRPVPRPAATVTRGPLAH
jgi:hypothetical protein